jgi:hypothetical protein
MVGRSRRPLLATCKRHIDFPALGWQLARVRRALRPLLRDLVLIALAVAVLNAIRGARRDIVDGSNPLAPETRGVNQPSVAGGPSPPHDLDNRRHGGGRRTSQGEEHILIRFVGTLVLLALLVIVITLASYSFARVSGTPTPPPHPGEVRLVFDRPGVTAQLKANISTRDFGRTYLDYPISVDPSVPTDDLGFALVMNGNIRVNEEPLYTGGPARRENGCWWPLYIIPEQPLACRSTVVEGNDSFIGPHGTLVQTVAARITRSDAGTMFVQVTTYIDRTFSTSSGKRTYFQLPKIGTTYLPEGNRDIGLDLNVGHTAFVPAHLDVIIDYRKLAPTERLESVSPAPIQAGRLAWVKSDTVEAYGSIVDTLAEERGERWLFILGVFAGLAATAVVSLVRSALRLYGLLRRRPAL